MSDRHKEKAREIAAKGLIQNVKQWQDSIATALAEAEREGMRRERERASQLLAVITDVFQRCDIENDWTALLRELSAAILAEAGIAVTD